MRAFAILLLAISAAFCQGTGAGQGGGVFRVGGGVTAPALLRKVEPEYTEEARKAKYQGTVLLYIEVDPEGKPTNIRVQRALGLGLDEKAIDAVRQWVFRPGMKDGKPVTVAATIEVNFRLLNGWAVARAEFATGEGVAKPQLRGHAFPPVCASQVRLTAALDLDSNGAVTSVRILHTTDSTLDESVIEAVRKWQFEPARWRGAPQPSSGEIELACTP